MKQGGTSARKVAQMWGLRQNGRVTFDRRKGSSPFLFCFVLFVCLFVFLNEKQKNENGSQIG